MHHDLLPYIKSYTYVASTTGISVIRALFLEAPTDVATYEISDQYFFGDAFLVAPIVHPGGQRSVYFPAGTGKYLEYFGKANVYQGGTTTNVSVDVTTTPVYVREGAIVVRGDIYQGNNKWTKDWTPSLTVEIFPSWDVEEQVFTYYAGGPGNGTAVDIMVKTAAQDKSVSVAYGAVGVPGTIVLYTKDGSKNATLYSGGGHVGFTSVESLFS